MPIKDPEQRKRSQAAYRARNRERLAAAEKARRDALKAQNSELFAQKEKERRQKFKARHAHKEEFKERRRQQAREYYARNSQDAEFRRKNTERARKWVQENRDRANRTWQAIRRRRVDNDVQYRLAIALRRRLYMAIRGYSKTGSAVTLLGCSVKELKQHIEKKFDHGMTWANWGRDGWHIDHIRPLSSFDLTNSKQLAEACHYSNLQPLWARKNEAKGATRPEHWPANWERANDARLAGPSHAS